MFETINSRLLLARLLKFTVFVACAGYDDGSAPADHSSAAQGGQHKWPGDEKGEESFIA